MKGCSVRPYRLGVIIAGVLILGSAPAVATPWSKMSPAGQAAYKAEIDRETPDLMALFRTQRETRAQIDREAGFAHPDWTVVRRLMSKDAADGIRERQLSDAMDQRLFDTLPEADRLLWLRDRYRDASPPPITISPRP